MTREEALKECGTGHEFEIFWGEFGIQRGTLSRIDAATDRVRLTTGDGDFFRMDDADLARLTPVDLEEDEGTLDGEPSGLRRRVEEQADRDRVQWLADRLSHQQASVASAQSLLTREMLKLDEMQQALDEKSDVAIYDAFGPVDHHDN